jgi:tryptophan synthase alpha chain
VTNRISQRFSELSAAHRAGLVTFITAGDPDPQTSLEAMHALVRGGADLLELGVPFSDPMADGPTIQRASERALAAGMSLGGVLELVRAFRAEDAHTPVVLMGYLNPIECMGYAAFASRAAAAGVDGVLTVDLPPEESGDYHAELNRHGLEQIYLLAPTSGQERVRAICAQASGFVYYVSVKGVTGGKSSDAGEVERFVTTLKGQTRLPVGVGFGVRTPDSAAGLAGVADAVIVGSVLVEIIEELGSDRAGIVQRLEAFAADMRRAMDARRAA